MATVSNGGNSKRMYSWWWDSHISPKNSKWLQENLTDMDSKVKQMIKLIEEDADSFARRAEMYYKKRPELVNLVEEFYRAYRALAERYDHATGIIRHAHRTMSEVFPNQIPMVFGDESPAGSNNCEADPRTPAMPHPVRAGIGPDELQKDAIEVSSSPFHDAKRNEGFTEEPDSVRNTKGLKQLNDLFGSEGGRARKGLNFHDGDEKGRNDQSNRKCDLEARLLSESDRVSKAEAGIVTLKNALAKLEAEKEASLGQCQQSLERLSNLESEVSRAQDESKGLNERASQAEAEVKTLKENISKLESEKETSLLRYQQCLQKIADLETSVSKAQRDAAEINERASKAEAETQAWKQALARVEVEKEATLVQYEQCLEKISNLEERLRKAEEDVRRIRERSENAKREVENLKQTISKLIEEKEASALQYHQCLDTIADLKLKLFHAKEEAQWLNREMEDGVAKLKVAEEKCVVLERSNQTLHSELDSLLKKLGNQSLELTEKQKELGKLWTSVQEERLRFLEAETAFQTLQHLQSQSQEELRSLAAELQTRSLMLKDMETHNIDLQEEVQKVKEENKGLNEINLSSATSVKSLQEEISSLRETVDKLEAEVELRVDQRNALQQEIYCLKEELRESNEKHQAVVEQVELVGLDPDCFGSSVKELLEENSKLKDAGERERSEKMALLEKLEIMEKLVKKKVLLENSISDLNAELEAIRGKLKTLEEASQSILEEKSVLVAEKDTLISQLQIATVNSEKISEKYKFLENSLFNANAELEGLRINLKSLEDSSLILDSEKTGLITERDSLVSLLDIKQKTLEDLEKGQEDLKMKVLESEAERESSLQKIEELGVSLNSKNQEYTSFEQLTEARMHEMESRIHHFEEEKWCREKEYQEELDRGVNSQIEIFILQKCLQDLQEKNYFLMGECQGFRETSKVTDKLISDLELENHEQQIEIESLIARIKILRMGLYQVLEKLEIEPELWSEDENAQDQRVKHNILNRLNEMQNILLEIQDENQLSAIENFVLAALLRQIKSEAAGVAAEKSILDQEFRIRCQQLSSLQSEILKLAEMKEELRSKVKEGGHREELLKAEIENFYRRVLNWQSAYKNLQVENCKILDEKRSLANSVVRLEEEKHNLEEDISLMLSETICQSSLSLIFKEITNVKLLEVKKLSEDLSTLHSIRDQLEEKLGIMEGKLKDAQTESSQLIGSLERSERGLISIRSVNDQLTPEIANVKDLLSLKEKKLLETIQIINLEQYEKTELSKTLEDLQCRYDEVKMKLEEHEKHILKLGIDYDGQIKETRHVSEVNLKLEAELQKLLEELDETKKDKETLSHELLKERSEVELWEFQAAACYVDLQIFAVREELLEGKASELNEACISLETRCASKDMEINQLKEKLSSLEDKNGGLKVHVAKYTQAMVLLNDSIKSLENHIFSGHKFEGEVSKGIDLVNTIESRPQEREHEFPDLLDMRLRIKAIEEAVTEKEKLRMLEKSNADSKLVAMIKQIKELNSSARRSSRQQEEDRRHQKQTHGISEEERQVIIKDIMLDEASDCSSYGISIREHTPELWETSGQSSGIELKLKKRNKLAEVQTAEAVREKSKGKSLSEESLVIDKLEISERFSGSNQQVNNQKVLERLDSDLQKLETLKITIQDLKDKVEINNERRNRKVDEQDAIKDQLEEAEDTIVKLFDVNRKLTTKVENGYVPSNTKSIDLDEDQRARTRRISEQARRTSEKIGRLQLEVRKIHYFLMKLDGEKDSRASKTKVSEGKTRVLLKDYIHGGMRTGQKKKKGKLFCACV